jgi:hypothetical protein
MIITEERLVHIYRTWSELIGSGSHHHLLDQAVIITASAAGQGPEAATSIFPPRPVKLDLQLPLLNASKPRVLVMLLLLVKLPARCIYMVGGEGGCWCVDTSGAWVVC